METLTSKLAAALRDSHVVAVTCTIVPPTGTPFDAPVMAGEVTGDRTSQVRRAGTVRVPWRLDLPPEITGIDADLRELPFGGYCDLRRGVRYADGTTDVVRLGYLRVESVTYGAEGATADIALADRMAQIQDELLQYPVSAEGYRPTDYATHLVQDVFGNRITYSNNVPAAAQPSLVGVTFDTDRAEAVATCCRSVSSEGYFDTAGNWIIDPTPDPATTPPVWTIDAGVDGVMVQASESYDRTGVYNGVLIRGTNASGYHSIRVLVVVTDPSSPFLWGGPYGRVLHIEESNTYPSAAAAQQAAQTMLNDQLGLVRSITMHAVPNPALAPGDVIEVVFPDGRDETHVIDAIRIPLNAVDPVELATRLGYVPGLAGTVELERFATLFGRPAEREADERRRARLDRGRSPRAAVV